MKLGVAALFALATSAAAQDENTATAEGSEQGVATVAELQALANDIEPFSVRVVGIASGTSEWSFLQHPFWTETVQELSNGKVTATINSMSELNLQGGDVFQLVGQGTFQVADVVANYGAGEVSELDALDLAGVAPTFEDERKVIDAYLPVLGEALKERFDLVTLGGGPATGQVFFCDAEISSIEDLEGLKVRVSSSTIADVVSGLGATPMTITFAEVIPALERGVIDCAITGTMSGNTARFYEVADHLFTLVVGWAPNIRVVNGDFWNGLSEMQQEWLELATEYYFAELSDPLEMRNNNQGIWCNTGDKRCTLAGESGVELADMTLVAPSEADREAMRQIVEETVLPSFAQTCGEECTTNWNESIGEVMGLEAQPTPR